jgi:2-oxoisovalerate dehydrogenase E1 component
MSKQLFVDPNQVRKPETLSFPPIPVNEYQKTVKDEKKNFTKEEFLHIYRDMCYIREFETMLNLIKTTNEYNGVQYNHPGPAHLGIGQEAAYVGAAYELTLDDYTFVLTAATAKYRQRFAFFQISTTNATEPSWKTSLTAHAFCSQKQRKRPLRKSHHFLLYGKMCEPSPARMFHQGLGVR